MPDIYEGDLTTVIDSVWAGLPEVVQTSGRVFVPIGNGHAAWEMALSNTLSRGDHVLVLNCGRFAAIWAEMAEFNGLNVEVMEAEEGFANEPSALEERLRADVDRKIAAVLTVHVDTATSVRNDVPALRQAIDAAGHPALFMVDCIASMGCERFEMDAWGVDVTIAASQKGMMTPPGWAWSGRTRKHSPLTRAQICALAIGIGRIAARTGRITCGSAGPRRCRTSSDWLRHWQ